MDVENGQTVRMPKPSMAFVRTSNIRSGNQLGYYNSPSLFWLPDWVQNITHHHLVFYFGKTVNQWIIKIANLNGNTSLIVYILIYSCIINSSYGEETGGQSSFQHCSSWFKRTPVSYSATPDSNWCKDFRHWPWLSCLILSHFIKLWPFKGVTSHGHLKLKWQSDKITSQDKAGLVLF